MVYLPTEILAQIIEDLGAKHSKAERLSHLACVDRQWQTIVENIVWREIRLKGNDFDTFQTFCRPESTRRQSVRHLVLLFDDYFTIASDNIASGVENADEDTEGDEDESETDGSEKEEEMDDPTAEDAEEGQGTFDSSSKSEKVDDEDKLVRENRDNDDDESNRSHSPKSRQSLFRHEHMRFFQHIKIIWDELESWNTDLKVTYIELYVNGGCIYELLGRKFRSATTVNRYIAHESWILSGSHLQLPSLPSVRRFMVSSTHYIDLWPSIIACQIARTFHNLLSLVVDNTDHVKTWMYARKEFRKYLTKELLNIPPSIQELQLGLSFGANLNQDIKPPCFLLNGVDHLSQTLSQISMSLTKVAIEVNQISADLFWNMTWSTNLTESSRPVLWPNLKELNVRTGIETASGGYCLRSSDHDLPHHPFQFDDDYYSDDEDYTENEQLERQFGDRPYRVYRDRPKPEYFNVLSMSIARAAVCMPKLASLSLELISNQSETCSETGYQGWGFHFRAGNDARYPDTHFLEIDDYPGIDRRVLERPRAEWVFQCPFEQVQWHEPEEAQSLWRKKADNIELDLVTFEYYSDRWERRRGGIVVDL